MTLLFLGNCQMMSCATLMQAVGYEDQEVLRFNELTEANLEQEFLNRFEAIIVHDNYALRPTVAKALSGRENVVAMPVLAFDGHHPDDELRVTYSNGKSPFLSKIAVGAFRRGLSRSQALDLYSPEFCDLMRYPEALDRARTNMIRRLAPRVPQIESLITKWSAQGPFFYTINHPKLFVVEDVLRHVLHANTDITLPLGLSEFCADPLRDFAISPQLNHPDLRNRVSDRNHVRKHISQVVTCRQFIDYTYDLLSMNRKTVVYDEASNKQFDAALDAYRDLKPLGKAVNPYRSQPDRAYWNRTVARPASTAVSPVGWTTQLIGRDTKVATAGSCFAQHVARAMVADGLTYYVAEEAPATMAPELAAERGYGLFSARFGNIYSSQQLLQLIQRAYGEFTPIESAWPVQGGFVDPFRPNIGETFESPEAVATARAAHLAQVREMFETLDVFVFTMGLTESWIDRRDNAAFPVAPAAVSDGIDPRHYGFVNADYNAVRRDMSEFLARLAAVNPRARVLLTVSPVPLIATYTETDVLSATTYSKSVLRAVAGDLATTSSHVFYFPSYEIITGQHAQGAYFEKDLRSVKPEGVAHVMRVFREILVTGDRTPAPVAADEAGVPDEEYTRQLEVVCDEEMLLR